MYLFVDKKTPIHRLDGRTKMLMLLSSFIFSIINNDIYILAWILFSVLTLVVFSKVSSNIKKIAPLIILISVLSILIWYAFGRFSKESLSYGITTALKIVIMMIAGVIFLSTTKNEEVFLGLKRIGLPYTFGFATSLALRLLPTFIYNIKNIYEAQTCRGLDLKKGNLIIRLKNYIPLMLPVFLVTLRSTDQLSMALESKGFGARQRSHYIETRFRAADFVMIFIITVLLVINIYKIYFSGQHFFGV